MPDIYVAPPDKNINQDLVPEVPPVEQPSGYKPLIHTHNPLAAFSAYPDGIRFETQEDKEEIILLLRRHVITNFFWVLGALVLILIGPFVISTLHALFPFRFPLSFQLIGMIIWYLLTASFIFLNFLSWYYNVYIVTNERIVDVDFYNLTYKQIASAPLAKIQDVTIRSGGVIRTIFDFADVIIQTAGEEENIHFEAVPKPDLVARQVLELIEKDNNPV